MPRLFRILLLIAATFAALATPSVGLAQPAPYLTQVRAIDVMSTGYGYPNYWDPVPNGAIATTQDHYGPYLYVAFLESGYAIGRQAQFNGSNMTFIQSIPQYGPYPYVVGWIQVYGYYGSWTSGTVTYQAQSIGNGRTYSTRLYVR